MPSWVPVRRWRQENQVTWEEPHPVRSVPGPFRIRFGCFSENPAPTTIVQGKSFFVLDSVSSPMARNGLINERRAAISSKCY
jgi:hypothetical protein